MRGNTTCAELEQNLTFIMCKFEMSNTFLDRFLVPCSVNIHVIEGSIKCDLKSSKCAHVRISFYLKWSTATEVHGRVQISEDCVLQDCIMSSSHRKTKSRWNQYLGIGSGLCPWISCLTKSSWKILKRRMLECKPPESDLRVQGPSHDQPWRRQG